MTASEELSFQMADKQKRLEQTEVDKAAEERELEVLRRQEREAEKALRELVNKRIAREQSVQEKRVKSKQLKSELDGMNREFMRRAHEEKQAAEREKKEALFRERLAGTDLIEKALPHQLVGSMFLANAGQALCGDDMGTGKTFQSIMYAKMVDAQRVLIVAPNGVVPTFFGELQSWAPDRLLLNLMGMAKPMRETMIEMYRNVPAFTVILGYSAWVRDPELIEQLKSMQFDTIICDEAHKMKDEGSQAYKGVRKLRYEPNKCELCDHWQLHNYKEGGLFKSKCMQCGYVGSMWNSKLLSVKNFLAMTGTNVINKPSDTFAPLHLVNRAVFPNRKKFVEDYCEISQSGRMYWNWGGEKRLANEIKAFFIRRKRHETGVVLPPQKPVYHEYELTGDGEYAEQFIAYEILRDLQQVIAQASEDSETLGAERPIVHLTRMRQMITWPAGIEWKNKDTGEVMFKCDIQKSIKVDKAVELAEEIIEGGGRVVLFSQFKKPLIEIQRRMGERCALLVADTGQRERDLICEDFGGKIDGPFIWDMVAANYKVGGLGINLVGATDAILLDREWSPALEDQALKRIDRMGQKRETRAHYIRIVNTVDDRIDNLIHEKANMVNALETEINLMQVLRDAYA